jgi:hypothetical protein
MQQKKKNLELDPMVNSVDDQIRSLEIEQKLIWLRQQAKDNHKAKTDMKYQ